MTVFASNVPAVQPFAAGQYFMPEGYEVIATGVAAAAGLIRMTPFRLSAPQSISALFCRITTAGAAGGLFQASIYRGAGLSRYPLGDPIYTSASQAVDVAGPKEISGLSLQLNGGCVYWFGVQADTTGAAAAFAGSSQASPSVQRLVGAPTTGGLASASNQVIGYTKAGSFGVWPTLTGNYTTDGLGQAITITCPAVALKAA